MIRQVCPGLAWRPRFLTLSCVYRGSLKCTFCFVLFFNRTLLASSIKEKTKLLLIAFKHHYFRAQSGEKCERYNLKIGFGIQAGLFLTVVKGVTAMRFKCLSLPSSFPPVFASLIKHISLFYFSLLF